MTASIAAPSALSSRHEALLAALPGDTACGPDLSFEAEFDTIRELRREDDPTLSQGEWVTDLKRADWPGVVTLCAHLLAERSKDLRVAGWWLDASSRLNGYEGLADGLALVEGLCSRYWQDVHPRADEGEWEQRVGNLSWLVGRIEAMAKLAPILRAGDERYSLIDVRGARLRRPKSGDANHDGESAVDRSVRERDERVLRSLRAVPVRELELMHGHALRARNTLAALEAVVDRELGQDGPAFASARQALAEAVHEVERLWREAGGGPSSVQGARGAQAVDASTINDAGAGTALNLPAGALATRAQALAQLRQVADFFRRTEPHSPVAYLADKAAQWGDMPLHAWLRSVMREPSALAHLEELLGIEPPRERE